MTKACGFAKATMYTLSPLLKETFKRGLTKEKLRYCHTVTYKDEMTARPQQILGVCSIGMLC